MTQILVLTWRNSKVSSHHISSPCHRSSPLHIMPVTQHLRVCKAHNASTGHPLLCCLFEGCECQFQSRNNLTRHQQTSHLPDAGPPHFNASLPPDKSNGHRYHCTFAGCLCSFTSKGTLTQHSCLQHFLFLHQQLHHCPPSILIPKHLRHCPQNHIHHAGHHFSSQKLMIKWTLIRTFHIMMTTILCPQDQTNHVAMAHIFLPAAQALLMAVPPTHLQLTVVHWTASSDHITLKSMVHLFKCVVP
jgi:hypothetical protein